MKCKSLCVVLAAVLVALLPLTSCSGLKEGYIDGYYTAEMDDFDSHGWKEFITICVSDGKIVTVEYNAKNKSGMIKSWDMDYMRRMNAFAGSYPNQYTRAYGGNLLKNQNADNIDAITGASHSYKSFNQLADAILDLAENGDKQIVFVTANE